MRKRQEVKNKTKKSYVLYYIVLLGIFVAICAALSMTEFFKIERVLVSGNNKYPEENLIATADITLGTSIFALDREAVKNRLVEEYIYVEDVNVKMNFPPTIILDIEQAQPVATIKNGEQYLLISEEGRILEEVEENYGKAIPTLLGINMSDSTITQALDESSDEVNQTQNLPQAEMQNDELALNAENITTENEAIAAQAMINSIFVPGEKLPEAEYEKMLMVSALDEAIENTGFGDVDMIDAGDVLNLVVVYDSRLIIELGAITELEYKLNFIMQTSEYNNPNFYGVIDATILKQLRVREADVSEVLGEGYDISSVEVENLFPSIENPSG